MSRGARLSAAKIATARASEIAALLAALAGLYACSLALRACRAAQVAKLRQSGESRWRRPWLVSEERQRLLAFHADAV